MELHEPRPLATWRIVALGLLMLAGLSLLALRLYHIQVVNTAYYEGRQTRQSVRRVLLPSPRGRIFDRHGRLLADNEPNYCIALYVEELRQPGRWSNTVNAVDAELDELAAVLRLPRACSRQKVEAHVARALPLPLIAWEHADDAVIARLTESRRRFPGVDVFVQPERTYPQGLLAAHLLGYVGRDNLEDEAREGDYQYRLPGMKGRSGIEREYDDQLCGVPGGQLICVDAVGYRHHEWIGRQPVPGRDLTLTIDAKVQTALEAALADVRGAGVVLDARNGEVLALASAPTYDPNTLTPAPSPAVWRALMENPDHPLLNRAIAGSYPPGSTFKPLVALAALTLGRADPDATRECQGTFQLGTRVIHCANGEQHGVVNMRKALEVSCNVYFCGLARDIGYDAIQYVAQQAGLGRRTGIDLPGETPGLLPTAEWKKARFGEEWTMGDTCNVAIGQGMLLTSPLQMAVAAAAIANGGVILRPRLTRGGRPEGESAGRADWPADALAVVRGGMADAVAGGEGTGRRLQIAGVAIAAKTGTAEYGPASNRRKYGWMIAFAPIEAPRVAAAMVVEDAVTGGVTVAPRLQRVLLAIFGDEIAAGQKGGA